METSTRSVAVIGFGAIAQSLKRALERHANGPRIDTVLLPPASRRTVPDDIVRCADVDALMARAPDLVVECAGHSAIDGAVPEILRAGTDVIIVSAGALANDATLKRLEAAMEAGGARAIIASGAIGGLDVLRTARRAGLDEVVYCGRKPLAAWAGTPAESAVDLASLTGPATFYEGTARQAARDFPKNANVTATVALAGVGFERTKVKLIADPDCDANTHELTVRGAFGHMQLTLTNHPLPDNPKTSWLTALSVEEAIMQQFASLRA